MGEWQHLIEQQADSGQSQAVFCAAHGLSQTTFQHWKRRLKSSASPVEALFAPLTDTPVPPEPDNGWTMELDLGDGVCLRLRRGVIPPFLAQIKSGVKQPYSVSAWV